MARILADDPQARETATREAAPGDAEHTCATDRLRPVPDPQTAAPATTPRFVSVAESSALSSNLIGLDVTNAGDQTIGEIKDVVLAADKSVQGFVVSVGGFLGMGEHYVVVDPSAVDISYDAAEKTWQARMNAMVMMPVKGLQIFTDRHGRRRCYHRATKTAIDLTKFPEGTPEFAAEVARIGASAQKIDAAKPGTLGKLVTE